jgi:hypothetical protein
MTIQQLDISKGLITCRTNIAAMAAAIVPMAGTVGLADKSALTERADKSALLCVPLQMDAELKLIQTLVVA